jgi:alanine dehydrogenase
MIVGVLKEIKRDENRVAVTPSGVEMICRHGHELLLEKGAGAVSGFTDDDYAQAGARLIDDPSDIYAGAEMLLRVKEPQPSEFKRLKEDQIYFSYLHLATSGPLTRTLQESGVVAIAYETVQKADGSLPLLVPSSEVSGPMAIQEGAKYLERAQGGRGVLLGGVPGVDPATVLIIGGGVVGLGAAKMACGLGANVYILDTDLERLRYLSDVMPSNCFTSMSNPTTIRTLLSKADVVVGAVLVPGALCPILVTREMLASMKEGAVIVDVAIDQGGCFETSKETTHSEPTYIVDGIVHYAVSNMPGALPQTSSVALANATLPYALEIADKGWRRAMQESPEIRCGANVVRGQVTYPGVADALEMRHTPIDTLL